MTEKYRKLWDMPRPVSQKHPPMRMADRAAQFSPFQALSGYGDAVTEAGRQTEGETVISEDQSVMIDQQLQRIAERLPEKTWVSAVCYRPDAKKDGGEYRTIHGCVVQLTQYPDTLVFDDGTQVRIDSLIDLETEENGNEETV